MSSRTNNTSRSSATTSSGSTRQTNNTSRTNNTGRTNNAKPTFDRFRVMRELRPRFEDKSKNVNFYRDLVDVLKYAGKSDDHLQRTMTRRLERTGAKLKEGIKNLNNRRASALKIVADRAYKAFLDLDDRVRKLEGRPSRATSQAAFTLAGLDSSNLTSGSSTSGSSTTTTSSGTKRRRTGGKKKRKSRRKRRRKIRKTKRKKKRSKRKTRRRR